MRSFVISVLILFVLSLSAQQRQFSKDTVLMGSAFNFTVVHGNETEAWQIINTGLQEVVRIESLISSWQTNSETSQINKQAGIQPVKVSWELFQLIIRCQKLSALSNGFFDISFASIDQVWQFNGQETEVPSEDKIKQSVSLINYENIILNTDDTTVYLTQAGMKIGFGAIGKGYAADMAKKIMLQMGASAGLVNAGGDLLAWGTQTTEEPWQVGIADPQNKQQLIAWLDASGKAVVTSGNYEKFVLIDGKRYGHIINPQTGWPVLGTLSVTIITESAELADGLATAVFALGPEAGLQLIDQLNGVEGLIVTVEGDILYSKNMQSIKD